MTTNIYFFNTPTLLKNRSILKKFLNDLAKKESKSIHTLNVVFCTDKELLKMNQSYLQHNDLTDILTFEYSGGKKEPIEGDIFISIERVKENAKKFHTTQINELRRVIFHGLLHLCGYKDKKESDKKIMKEKEDYYLNAFSAN